MQQGVSGKLRGNKKCGFWGILMQNLKRREFYGKKSGGFFKFDKAFSGLYGNRENLREFV